MNKKTKQKKRKEKEKKRKKRERWEVRGAGNAHLTNHRPRLLRFPPPPSRLFHLEHSHLPVSTHFYDPQVSILIKFPSLSRVSLLWG